MRRSPSPIRRKSPSPTWNRSQSPSRRQEGAPSSSFIRGGGEGFPHPIAPRGQPTSTLGVFGLNPRTRERDLEELYRQYGKVEKIILVYDRRTGHSRGFGFVYYTKLEEAKSALEKTNGMRFDGRNIRVDYSLTEKPHSPTPGNYLGRRSDFESNDRDRYRPPTSSYARGGPSSNFDSHYHSSFPSSHRGRSRSPPPSLSMPPPPPSFGGSGGRYHRSRSRSRERSSRYHGGTDNGDHYSSSRDYDRMPSLPSNSRDSMRMGGGSLVPPPSISSSSSRMLNMGGPGGIDRNIKDSYYGGDRPNYGRREKESGNYIKTMNSNEPSGASGYYRSVDSSSDRYGASISSSKGGPMGSGMGMGGAGSSHYGGPTSIGGMGGNYDGRDGSSYHVNRPSDYGRGGALVPPPPPSSTSVEYGYRRRHSRSRSR